MKKLYPFLIMTVIVLFLNGCKKDKTSTGAASNQKVYVSGATINASGKLVATVWVDAVPVYLTDGSRDAAANDLYVSGTDIYVTGWVTDLSGNSNAVVWKNGVVQNLPGDGSSIASGERISVTGGKVYVIGSVNAPYKSTFWIDGIKQASTLPVHKNWDQSNGLFVSGTDVYICGQNKTLSPGGPFGYGDAVVMKNGAASFMGMGTNAFAEDVFVSGGDTYVAGGDGSPVQTAILWKNGVKQPLSYTTTPPESAMTRVFVSGSDVYAVGFATFHPTGGAATSVALWKNGTAQEITNGSTAIHRWPDLFVSGTDVYISYTLQDAAGNTTSKVWKNGSVLQNITGTTIVTGIFVK